MLSSLETSTDPILITGEPGTGKELLARVVASRLDANCLFIKYNCAALLPKMVSCYRLKGATDRAGEDIGDVNRPRSATILLDRIDRLSKKTQSEMLLLLDDVRKIIPIQFWDDALDIRYIATSEVGLENSLSNGAFRKDLYYRLNVLPIQIPPLRARKEDIPLLADLFSIEACAKTFKSYQVLSTKTKERLRCYEWPNNVQELKRLVQRICLNGNDSDIFSQKGIPDLNTSTPESFFYAIESGMLPDVLEIRNYLSTGDNTSLKSICAKFVTRTEKKLVQKALETTNWNRKRAASLLNISYKSMLNKMKMYEIV